ncbi:cytochrome c peroxidase [Sulfurivirga caldicuralii]|uniref:Cytochrome c peroxidase n=1 Tax=Sulfurivirga caldicuralii TaxID=364032 RepID=A0A1N6GMG1_9GAMM|nr:cytochrome c peroxidase [Sulfurivirga caldicuralii]SIO08739.1 cytochrome c peroxidase [Sulfurivirga caldicuralii]
MNVLRPLIGLVVLLPLLWSCSDNDRSTEALEKPAFHNALFDTFVAQLTTNQTQLVQPIPYTVPVNHKAAALGKQLYFSPFLSANNTIACATCHILSQGGDDNRPVSIGIHGQKGELNTPTVLNAGFNLAQFWDGRATTLEEQAAFPLTAAHEMGNPSLQAVIERLNADATWRQRFMDTFGQPASVEALTFAIAEYERTLITPGSRFDRYLQGDDSALTPLEKQGWALFQTRGCIGCHQGINLGGNLFQKAGVFEPLTIGEKWQGRFHVTHDPADRYMLKVPTLRNIAETAPYFHDGQVKTLETAVRLMIQHQLGLIPDDHDVTALVAFLKTLSAPVREDGS